MSKINCLKQKLHPIALRCMTAAELQQLLEELCALPEPEFQELLEMKIKEKQEEEQWRGEQSGNIRTKNYTSVCCPCDLCEFSPPSSGDGKPCSICPAVAKEADNG